MLGNVWLRGPIERARRLIDLEYGACANARDALEEIRADRVS